MLDLTQRATANPILERDQRERRHFPNKAPTSQQVILEGRIHRNPKKSPIDEKITRNQNTRY